jgi:valyl-tRNA synthetase
MELDKIYQPNLYEKDIYQQWLDSESFNPDKLPFETKGRFCVMMPPPNATGVLHLGHALTLSIEDVFVRYHRLLGEKTLWLPGTDHAAIATQTKVEKVIAEEGLTRQALGREKFLDRVRAFVSDSQDTIRTQVKAMGSSCDWSREAYTFSDDLSASVNEIFIRMYNDGLIYRGPRLVNWCSRCGSTLADDEVIYKEQSAKLYYFKYNKDFPFVIATTRPETKLGDTAVAVNPNDERYKDYIGKEFDVDFVGVPLKLKIIGDASVDPNFGTGALGVTPGHSLVDYEMKEKNNLRLVEVIGQDGKIKAGFAEYTGMEVEAARALIVEKLRANGLMEKEEDLQNNLSVCYRCGTAIEPLISTQWFIDVNKKIPNRGKSLKELSLEAVNGGLYGDKNKEIKILPDRFVKIYDHWMENLRDWCISRQIWWGHRIPVYYCDACGQTMVAGEAPSACDKCGGHLRQDEDTLDTWFSSGLWTFSPLGWPKQTEDLKKYHPTDVLETGHDILFFWVARMILMTTYALDDIPFKNVYLHGMVRDGQGRKMSKSLGNGIDPLEMIEKYGADALRLSLIVGNGPGSDIPISEEKIASFRNFVNKLWNISRFILGKIENVHYVDQAPVAKTLSDRWILGRLAESKQKYFDFMNRYEIALAGDVLMNFTWDDFADWYLEIAKVEGDKDEILLYVWQNLIRLWHPFLPFVTEVLWKSFAGRPLLLVDKWETTDLSALQAVDSKDFELLREVIGAIRNVKNEYKITANNVEVRYQSAEKQDLLENNKEVVLRLAKIALFEKLENKDANAISKILSGAEIFVSMPSDFDVEKEMARVTKEIADLENLLRGVQAKLDNAEFVGNAPAVVVEKEKAKAQDYTERLEKLGDELKKLEGMR